MHWARDADEANRIIVSLIQGHGEHEVIKVKTMTSDETRLNEALEAAGITPFETDLADLIIQLGHDRPSHIVVPALHRNRAEIRALFQNGRWGWERSVPEPEDLAGAARQFLREKFLRVKVGFSGANFAIADTGGICVVESEGNGRMCVTLPKILITLVGIEKVVPSLADLEVFLQLLPRSATGERMNPYNSIWTGTRGGDGPEEFHVVLLDNGRTRVLEDAEARETLHCIRCARLPQRLPGLSPDRRPRLRLDLQRSDRRDPDPAAAGHGALDHAAVCVVVVRRVLRGMPGQDQHPRDPDPSAPAHRRGRIGRAPKGWRCAPPVWRFRAAGGSAWRSALAGSRNVRSPTAARSPPCPDPARAGPRPAICRRCRRNRSGSGGRAARRGRRDDRVRRPRRHPQGGPAGDCRAARRPSGRLRRDCARLRRGRVARRGAADWRCSPIG